VLVTGATGFIGTHVVEQLLARGYHVRGTVRNIEKATAEGILTNLPGAERLELVAADLLDAASFQDAVMDCDFVLHVASPYVLDVKDPQTDLVDPAIQGTIAVLRSCMESPAVRRVVVTSSFAAMVDSPNGTLTEESWNEGSSLKQNPYAFSKTMAERAAWSFMEGNETHFDLVVVNASGVVGPEHASRVNTTNRFIADMTSMKSPFVLDLPVAVVDVRDVANAHIAAMETEDASGRYLCGAWSTNFVQIVDQLSKEFPDTTWPKLRLEGPIGTRVMRILSYTQPSGMGTFLRSYLGKEIVFDNSKIKRDLGITFRPLSETLGDTVRDMIASGKIKS
jgi:dihydroflavonol-4-reductase